MGSVLLKSMVWVVVICVGLALLVGIVPPVYESLTTSLAVPGERDPAVVGTWRAQMTDYDDKPKDEPRKYEFRADGRLLVTFQTGGTQDMTWGTYDGKLTVRYFSVDAWVAPTYAYKVDASGNHLTIPARSQRYGRILRDYTRVAGNDHP